ncbi:right-handed parallel beta-helix repeat-containing protein [Candidatus Bipolaricaulota bacterium]
MKKLNWMVLVSCCLVAFVAIAGIAQTDDGPYFIVDPDIAGPWGNVFPTLQSALAFVTGQPNPEEMSGATIVLYPGVHVVGVIAGIDINVPGLRLISRDGANRTIIQATAISPTPSGPMVDVLAITAPGVVIEDITIQTLVGVNGIGLSARDCTLRNVTVEGTPGFVGISVLPGADNLLIDSVTCVGGTNGIQVGLGGAVYDVVVQNSSMQASLVNCVSLINAQRIVIESSTISGGIINGLNVFAASSSIDIMNCTINDNAGAGISALAAFELNVENCTFVGNAGFSVSLVGTQKATIDNCNFEETGGAAVLLSTSCSDVSILGNTMSRETSGPFPIDAISFAPPAPAATNARVENNAITGYASAVNFTPFSAPSNSIIAGNTISDTLNHGIWVQASGGGNEISGNTLLGCGGRGIWIAAASSDTYSQNTVTASTLSGIGIDDGVGAFGNLKIRDNNVARSGEDGIEVFATALGSLNVTISGNELRDNDNRGISVNAPLTGVPPALIPGVRIEDNLIVGNEQQGLVFASAPGCVITGNTITRNLDQGVLGTHGAAETRILRNSVYSNAGGGIEVDWAGAGHLVIEENFITENQGFAVTLTGVVPPPAGILPYPFGMSLASNWWGSPSGPAGFFGGTGNALLGLPALSINSVAPVLTAPTIESVSTKTRLVEYAQVSVIPSFASSKVTVNRLDTSGVRIVFSGVEARASGLVSTGGFTSHAIQQALPKPTGEIVSAVSVLVSGFGDGVAEASLTYEPSDIGDRNPDELQIMELLDATWVFDETDGTWAIEGGTWSPLAGCTVSGANLISVEIPVTDLRGKCIALALVLP